MTLETCDRCRKIFNTDNSLSDKLCANCYQQDRKQFRAVKDYLWHHPGATIEEIAANTEVEEKTIRKFVREGRFDLS